MNELQRVVLQTIVKKVRAKRAAAKAAQTPTNEGIIGAILGTAVGLATAGGVATDYFAMRAQRKAEKQAADTAIADHVRRQKSARKAARALRPTQQPRKPRKLK